MHERNQGPFPDWAERERAGDLAWIMENIDVFWTVSTDAFEEIGRGAIFVDTTIEPVEGGGNPFAYFDQEQVEEFGNDDTQRMVTEYDPTRELVVVLLKPESRVSTYRMRFLSPPGQEALQSDTTPSNSGETPTKTELQPPEIETLMAWEAEGGCEAACPHHCWVEPDGICEHGNPSWLLRLGLI